MKGRFLQEFREKKKRFVFINLLAFTNAREHFLARNLLYPRSDTIFKRGTQKTGDTESSAIRCEGNHRKLDISKTEELVMDYR